MFIRIRVLVFALLIAITFSFSLYVVKIHEVASHRIYMAGDVYWPSTGYSLFPQAYTPNDWPGFNVLHMLTPLTSTEISIVKQYVETSLLILIASSL